MSWPVPGTLMIEPTESRIEGRAGSLLRCDDPHPRGDPRDRERQGRPADNVLKRAPHTVAR
jgi:glycine cleavage system protein P-like pyridoxal-binding family